MDRDNQTLIYGRRAIGEVVKHRAEAICEIFVVKGSKVPEELTEFSISEHSQDELDELCEGGVHQGIAAIVKNSLETPLPELISFSQSANGKGLLAVLDQVSDPHNVGAIFRAVEALGFDGVVMTTDRSAPITPVVRKVSAGASELIKFTKVKNLQRALETLKKAGFWIAGTTLAEGASSLYEIDIPKPLAVVFGSEGQGIRRLTEKECDILISIPLNGVIESLNVSQAAAIVMAEILRQGLVR